MTTHERLYIPPPRPPRLGLDRPQYRWQAIGWLCAACAGVSGLVWWAL